MKRFLFLLPLLWLSPAEATVIFIVSPTGSNQSSTSPADWCNSNNLVETIGAGASGGAVRASGSRGAGGGGGAYNAISNFTFAAPGTTTYTWQVGIGGPTTGGVTAATSGTTGGDTWFNGTTLGGSSVGSKGGTQGTASTSVDVTGGAGGVAASGVGSGFNGGRGGNTSGGSATGGGGAAGSFGAGGNGGDAAANTTAGGQGDNGHGGAGGAAGNNAGSAGTEWDATHGSGGGGGGNNANGAVTAGSGGLYGGGGGGAQDFSGITGTATSGAGTNGIIVLTYTACPGGRSNLPLLGVGRADPPPAVILFDEEGKVRMVALLANRDQLAFASYSPLPGEKRIILPQDTYRKSFSLPNGSPDLSAMSTLQ